MKHLKLFLLVFVACIICNAVYAQQTDEVTLVVSADGPTKDEATKIALRSAIEQAYGTFVSANTTILNDELVKDEIVTISSGNIKDYYVISSNTMPDGKFFVTLNATVSISKLVSYAQSKGAETEFAGSTFGMNMKMKELNKKNEEIALNNLADQVLALYPSAFSYQLLVGEPKLIDDDYSPKINGRNINFSLPKKLSDIGLQGTYKDYYVSNLLIGIKPNQQMENITKLILTTISSLALSKDERTEYESLNIKTYTTKVFINYSSKFPLSKTQKNAINSICDEWKYDSYNQFTLRSNPADCFFKINIGIAKILNSFQIVDNLGNASKITSWEIGYKTGSDIALCPITGTNLLSAFSFVASELDNYNRRSYYEGYNTSHFAINLFDQYSPLGFGIGDDSGDFSINTLFEAFILFPKNEISKYSNFKIESTSTDRIVIEDPRKLLEINKQLYR